MQKGRSWGDLPSFPCSHLFAAQTIFLPAYCQHPFSEKRNHTWNRPVPCHTARVTTGWRWRPPLEESALSRYPPLSDEPSTRCLHVRPTATHLSSGSLWPETCIHAVIGFFFSFSKLTFKTDTTKHSSCAYTRDEETRSVPVCVHQLTSGSLAQRRNNGPHYNSHNGGMVPVRVGGKS